MTTNEIEELAVEFKKLTEGFESIIKAVDAVLNPLDN